jgi:hypothetical protein
MAGLQIRWRSVGRAAAIGVAVIAGIISLPALLGSDRPPPVPPDVGLTAPPAEPVPATVPPPPASPMPAPKRSGRRDHRLAKEKKSSKRSRPGRKGSKRRNDPGRTHSDETVPAPAALIYSPPVYSYVPPPSPGEFQIER